MGDFNARTGQDNDILEIDKFDNLDIPNINENNDIPPRNSEDKLPSNLRGKELIETCKALKLAIVNGRKNGDVFGKYTSFQWNGNGVVDYVITTHNLFHKIEYFTVGNYIPWLSDHCALHFKLKLSSSVKPIKQIKTPQTEQYKSFYWDKNSHEKFATGLEKCLNDIEHIKNLPDHNTQDINTALTKMIYKITKIENFKLKKRVTTKNPKWFDKECIEGKNKMRRIGKWLKTDPNNQSTRNDLNKSKRAFRKLTREKKRKYRENVVKNMNLSQGRGKIFWKSLDKLNTITNKNQCIEQISIDSWREHFKSIYCDVNKPCYPPNSTIEGPLDYEITIEELSKASYVLKNDKSCGIDMISNEMLNCIFKKHPQILIKLYNSALQNNFTVADWIISIVTPIHKKGSKMIRENYRGISLISCVYKLFSAILNNRLMEFCKERNILSEEQLGFMPGNRTSDAHFIIYNLIQDYCHKRSQKLYSCFVDLSKAFDTIPRELLFQKLLTYGITGKFFNILKNMYVNDKCKIKVGNNLSETIKTDKGVRQGCILSPLLFNIFLADLPLQLSNPTHENPQIGTNKELSCILWADDLVMFSKTEDGLQNMICKLSDYTKQNGLSINTEKTKCMIFNKTGKFIRRNFNLENTKIETVRQYKYLGFIIKPSGEINSGLKDLKSRGIFALTQLRNKMGEYFNKYPDTTMHLFDALIKPIILYMADFWGCLSSRKYNPVDITQNRFLKQMLGVQTQTTTSGILLETGSVPLSLFAQKYCIKNWERIAIKKQSNILVQTSYSNSLEKRLLWTDKIKSCLSINGMQNLFGNNSQVEVHKVYFTRIVDIFHQNSFADIRREDSKLRTYALIKTDTGIERYLNHIKNTKDRIMFTKFRLSNHNLMIEKGRHRNIDKSLRFCPFCPNIVEDEIHFLIKCKCTCYSAARDVLFKTVVEENKVPNFIYLETREQFKILLTHPDVVQHTAQYITKTMAIRDFLIAKHKNNT